MVIKIKKKKKIRLRALRDLNKNMFIWDIAKKSFAIWEGLHKQTEIEIWVC